MHVVKKKIDFGYQLSEYGLAMFWHIVLTITAS